MGRKSPKTHQREVPLESPGLICFFLFRPKSALGLVGRIGWHGASLGSFTPLIASTPSTRASSFGVEASPGRSRPGCTTGRAETRRTAHHPSSDGVGTSVFSSWYGKRPSARFGKQLLTVQESGGGFHKEGEGPSFGDSFPDFSSLRNRAQRSVPLARLARWKQPSVMAKKKRAVRSAHSTLETTFTGSSRGPRSDHPHALQSGSGSRWRCRSCPPGRWPVPDTPGRRCSPEGRSSGRSR